jgi:SAM-dependent methyltransferase
MELSPLTHTEDVTLIETIPSIELVHLWRRELNLDVAREFSKTREVSLYQCNETGLLFYRPSEIVGSAHLYADLQSREWYYQVRKWEHDVALDDLRGCRAVLEVGSGTGHFVERLIKELRVDATGIELNSSAAGEAQKRGLPVYVADLHDFAQEHEGSFDAVCSFQVLEHVSDPGNFLASLARLAKPGGVIILGVPNHDSYLRFGNSVTNRPPHHMSHWTEQVFHKLATRFPVNVSRVMVEPLSEDAVMAYATAYMNRFGTRRFGNYLVSRLLFRVVVPSLRKSRFLRSFLAGETLYVCLTKV